MKRIIVIISFLLILGLFQVAAEELQESSALLAGLDKSVLDMLEKNNHVFRYDEELSGNLYVPATTGAGEIRRLERNLNPEVMVEALYRIPYPDGFNPEEENILDSLYELSHRVSSINGVKYFSVRRKKYAVLFTDVYAVSDPVSGKKIDDPVPGSADYHDTLYLHMKENAMGSSYYRIEYDKREGMFTIKMVNESNLGFIVSVVNPSDMNIVLQVIPCSDSILVYGYCGVVLQNDDLVNFLLDPYYAFYRRMTAMETWLYNNLHRTDELPPVFEPLP